MYMSFLKKKIIKETIYSWAQGAQMALKVNKEK